MPAAYCRKSRSKFIVTDVIKMTDTKIEAAKLVDNLYKSNRISVDEHTTILSAITEIETLDSRDEELEDLWLQFVDLPVYPYIDAIGKPYLSFSAGTPREKILRWFNERYSRGVYSLLFGDNVNRMLELAKLYRHNQLCVECSTGLCVFNSGGVCMFPMVSGRKPVVDGEEGCQDTILDPGAFSCQ